MKKFFPALVIIALVAGMAVIAMDFFRPAEKEAGWTTDYKKAFDQAKAENKMIMIDFSGITWCLPCQVLHKQVFLTKKFRDYAEGKFILVKVDFPSPVDLPVLGGDLVRKYLPPITELTLPTVVITSPDGKMLGTTGYQPGGPDVFIASVEQIIKK